LPGADTLELNPDAVKASDVVDAMGCGDTCPY
jgi:hypothetical protein